MSVRLMLLSLAALAASLTVLAAPAQARTGQCVIGQSEPRCYVEYGRAPLGATDGDTIPVRIDGQRAYSRVRVTGVQAMELTDYVNKLGECKAPEATARVNALLARAKGRVRLAEQDPASSSRRRPLRSVAVKIKGRWVDLGTDLMKRGLAVPLSHHRENHFNAAYSALAERARKLFLGVFDPDGCGGGFQQGLPIQVWVNADPAGADNDHLDEEYVVVRNNDPVQALDLSGWWVRDGGLRRYTFAPGTLVAPGQTMTVHVGAGTDDAVSRWWGLRTAIFDNPSSAENGGRGDGAYLFDPEGDIRAAMIYPCREGCSDPLQGQFDVAVKPRGRQERVQVTSRATIPVTLNGYRLRSRGRTYAFGADDVLQPGATIRIDVQGYPEDDRPGRKSWGQVTQILPNRNGVVELQTFDDIQVGCASWGTGTCG